MPGSPAVGYVGRQRQRPIWATPFSPIRIQRDRDHRMNDRRETAISVKMALDRGDQRERRGETHHRLYVTVLLVQLYR